MARPDLFNHVIANLRYGNGAEELSEALGECVDRSRATNRVSTLNLQIKIKPNGDTGQYEITDKITTKLPEPEKGVTLMFGTPDGNLQRENPRQAAMDLRTVSNANDNEPLREVKGND